MEKVSRVNDGGRYMGTGGTREGVSALVNCLRSRSIYRGEDLASLKGICYSHFLCWALLIRHATDNASNWKWGKGRARDGL